MMAESRCGLRCSLLREKCKIWGFDCDGCSKIKTVPWGECEVKMCCESRGYEHCGRCPDFPCEVLKSFSFDETHGDNGERIDQCRKWSIEDDQKLQ